jgi:hypothetical protein
MKIKVYIASPYANGNQAANVAEQIRMFSRLLDADFIPFAPLLSHFVEIYEPRSREWWLEYDLEWLRSCDCLLRLPGESEGADLEVTEAKRLHLQVFYSFTELKAYYDAIN